MKFTGEAGVTGPGITLWETLSYTVAAQDQLRKKEKKKSIAKVYVWEDFTRKSRSSCYIENLKDLAKLGPQSRVASVAE